MNIRALYRLTKPGVTYGNLITAVAGYLFAARGEVDWLVFVALTIGTWWVIASACVINNYLDQDIDAVMERTKKRPLLTGEVTPRQALLFGTLLLVAGTALLAAYTNSLVVVTGLFGWVTYVWLYGALSKRKSVHGTLVGAVSGAAPILAGYLAASGVIDAGAVLVFAVLFFWQMPEFYSIAIFRRKEYSAAKVPLISVVKGVDATIRQIIFYTVAFSVSALLIPVYDATSVTYAVVMSIACVYWTTLSTRGLRAEEPELWARKMFRFSLVVLLLFSFLISVDAFLP